MPMLQSRKLKAHTYSSFPTQEEGSDVPSMLHDLGLLESYLSRFVEDADEEQESACMVGSSSPHAEVML